MVNQYNIPPEFEGFSENGSTQEYMALPVDKVPEAVKEYVAAIEAQRTNDWCKCFWAVHPDDENIPPSQCRRCGYLRDDHTDTSEVTCYNFQGRRMRKIEENPQCPVHTKEGFILGFFEWIFQDEH